MLEYSVKVEKNWGEKLHLLNYLNWCWLSENHKWPYNMALEGKTCLLKITWKKSKLFKFFGAFGTHRSPVNDDYIQQDTKAKNAALITRFDSMFNKCHLQKQCTCIVQSSEIINCRFLQCQNSKIYKINVWWTNYHDKTTHRNSCIQNHVVNQPQIMIAAWL